ncbi:hypothetical protein L3Q82_021131 [Scortum barcoo]|uniref:Uncharacterized protein n=1 Tax=Scortum barcoo TaxID=214431 RepID=A0ACB8X3B0_9TELE|nr:hypothetical protein L3Q82_021131 [Scortum barcoo]
MILLHNLDSSTSADTFSSRQVFVLLSVAVGGYWYFIFGSGTKLYVTDEQVVKPVVSVYPAASRAHLEGKSSLLCVASAMFPPLVQFSWKRQKEDGPLEELPPAEGEQLKLRESGCTGTIRVIDQDALNKYKYRCYVQHEGGNVEATEEQGDEGLGFLSVHHHHLHHHFQHHLNHHLHRHIHQHFQHHVHHHLHQPCPAAASFQSQCRVKLLSMLYSVLIVKSLVYCCGLSLLRILRNKGPPTNCTHAD